MYFKKSIVKNFIVHLRNNEEKVKDFTKSTWVLIKTGFPIFLLYAC